MSDAIKAYLLKMPETLHTAVKTEAAKTKRDMADIINEATARALGLSVERGGEHERRIVD